MANREELRNAVLTYASAPEVDYAIAITGPWGSGKTFFWKNELQPALAKLKRKTLYVSLYGVTKANEIDRLLLLAQYPFLKNGMLEVASKLTVATLKSFGFQVPVDGLKADLRETVLCFDDLERSDISSISETMGYINAYVEHEGQKVILLCDDTRLRDVAIYNERKEKLIGYTYIYAADPNDVIDSAIGKQSKQSHSFSDYLSSRKKLVISILEEAGQINLRTLRRALESFQRLFDVITLPPESYDVADLFLRLTLALTCALKKDDSKKSVLATLFDPSYVDWMIFAEEKTPERKYLDEFIARHFGMGFGRLASMTAIFEYVANGVLDESALKEQSQAFPHPPQEGRKTAEDLLLMQFWELTDHDFAAAAKAIVKKIRLRQETSPGRLIHIAQRLFYFANEKLIPYTGPQLQKLFLSSINNLAKEGRLGDDSLHETGFHLFISDLKDPNYELVKQRLLSLEKQRTESTVEQKIRGHFAKLKIDFMGGVRELVGEDGKPYTLMPIFDKCSVGELVRALLKAKPAEIIAFRNFLSARYENISNIATYLAKDNDNLLRLHQTLGDHLQRKRMSLSKHCLEVLQKTIKNASAILTGQP